MKGDDEICTHCQQEEEEEEEEEEDEEKEEEQKKKDEERTATEAEKVKKQSIPASSNPSKAAVSNEPNSKESKNVTPVKSGTGKSVEKFKASKTKDSVKSKKKIT
jgi:sRNA-binding protein